MIKRIIALFVIAAGIFSIIWFAPQVTLTVGDLPKADVLKVKAQDLSLVCPGGAFRTGGASGTSATASIGWGGSKIVSGRRGGAPASAAGQSSEPAADSQGTVPPARIGS